MEKFVLDGFSHELEDELCIVVGRLYPGELAFGCAYQLPEDLREVVKLFGDLGWNEDGSALDSERERSRDWSRDEDLEALGAYLMDRNWD